MSERSAAPGSLVLVESLVNTLDIESGADALDTADGRARFGLSEGEVAAARELRESLRAVLLAHAGHPPHATVTPLDELLASAPLRLTVDAADGSAALRACVTSPAGRATPGTHARTHQTPRADPAGDVTQALALADADPLLSRVAAALAESLVAGTWLRLKACESVTCHWAYYDRSPAGRGRWCSMQVCGARAKMRRYRAK